MRMSCPISCKYAVKHNSVANLMFSTICFVFFLELTSKEGKIHASVQNNYIFSFIYKWECSKYKRSIDVIPGLQCKNVFYQTLGHHNAVYIVALRFCIILALSIPVTWNLIWYVVNLPVPKGEVFYKVWWRVLYSSNKSRVSKLALNNYYDI